MGKHLDQQDCNDMMSEQIFRNQQKVFLFTLHEKRKLEMYTFDSHINFVQQIKFEVPQICFNYFLNFCCGLQKASWDGQTFEIFCDARSKASVMKPWLKWLKEPEGKFSNMNDIIQLISIYRKHLLSFLRQEAWKMPFDNSKLHNA